MAQLQRIDCTVEFVTPAFLGNASQQGQWRVPPFKALLRRWWRILMAREAGYDWERLRRREGLLWGNAFLQEGGMNCHSRSLIEVRMKDWRPGRLQAREWKNATAGLGTVTPSKYAVPVDLYLGYGPVDQHKKRLSDDREPAIAPGDRQQISFVMGRHQAVCDDDRLTPDDIRRQLVQTLHLVNMFGTLGSRASNGWGSLVMRGLPKLEGQLSIVRRLDDCLKLDWPHAIGKHDGKTLLWKSRSPHGSWQEAMRLLGEVLVACRNTAKPFRGPGITGVFLLGYPVQKPHFIRELGNQARWQSQLRFKVHRLPNNTYEVRVFQLPHRPPAPLWRHLRPEQRQWIEENQLTIWEDIHAVLDSFRELKR